MAKHSIVHIEISSKDRKKTAKFYGEVFGWKSEDFPEMNYTTFETGEGVGGGFNPVGDVSPAGTVTVYIGTEDVTESLKSVVAAGGKVVVPESDIPGMGKFGLFKDPDGNMIGLYKDLTK